MCVVRAQGIDKAALVQEVKQALYASKICSYAQGLNIIKAKSAEKDWGIDLGALSRIWKVRASAWGCVCDLGVCASGCPDSHSRRQRRMP